MEEDRGEKISSLMEHCLKMEKEGYKIILPGDIVDILEFGLEAIKRDDFCRAVWYWANHSGRIRLKGNHDAEPNLPASVVIDDIYISHWSAFDMLWGWLPIYRFPVPDWIVRRYKTPAKKKGELLDYHLSTAQIEFEATKFCVKKGYRAVVGGHTHSPFVLDREGYKLANSGDMVDSFTWLEGDTETNVWRLMR